MSYDLEPDRDREKPNRMLHPLEAPPPPPQPEDPATSRRMMVQFKGVKPYATRVLIAINVAIYVIAFVLMTIEQRVELYNWGASNRFYVLNLGEYHRLFTAMFLHSEMLWHVFFNMYALYIIGQTVERFFGHARFLAIYFLGGLTGSIMSVVLNDITVFSVGASGAVFAIFGAEMVFLYKHQKLFGPMARMQLRQLVFVAGINLFIGISSSVSNAAIRIDNWGHIGGLLGGLMLAWIIGPALAVKLHPTVPETFVADDLNPFQKNAVPVLIYAIGLVLIVAATASSVNG